MSMAQPKTKLHVAMFPWLAFGHIIPYFELSKLIAQKGHQISFISTPRNIQRLPKIPPNLAPLIDLVSLPLPYLDGLPHNAEATMDLPYHKIPYLKRAFDGLQDSLVQFLETSAPDWIIFDFAPHWLPPIAANLGISRAYFSIFNAWSLCFLGSSSSAIMNCDDQRTEPQHFIVPPNWVPFPSNVAFRLHEAKRFVDHAKVNDSGVHDFFRMGSALAGSQAILVRSCIELESQYLTLLEVLHCKPAVPIGLLPPTKPISGDDVDDTWQKISEWLNKQNKGSVVYVAFGSELNLSQDELNELALGLELSRLPFFWVLRKRHGADDGESVELPDGFEERTKGQGVVWTSWAPQLRIVGHESVGGFLTHCGFSSVTEALYFGRGLIMLPFSIDQGLIARVMEEKMVGIEVARNEEDGSFSRNSLAESLRLVMVDEEGRVYRDKAKEMRKLFADKDLHDRYIRRFVEYLEKHKPSAGKP